MQYRNLGRTGLPVSEVSFGAHLAHNNVKREKKRAEPIVATIEGGVNLFDIYDHSGYKQWEPMSKLLHPVRDEIFISLCTVWDSNKASNEVDYALEIFRTDHIDLYRFMLGGNLEENDRRLHDLLEAKKEGQVRAIRAAVHVPSITFEGLKMHAEELHFVMVPLSYCFRKAISEKELIARYARKHGIGTTAMKPLCGHEEPGRSRLSRLALPNCQLSRLGTGRLVLGRLIIKALLQSDLVSTVMPSMNSVQEVLEDIAASGAGPLTDDERILLDLHCEELKRKGKSFLKTHHWLWNWR